MTEQERNELHERIAQVKERVARAAEKAGKKPEDIILVAASKMNDTERVQEAIRAGIEVCGENRVQELLEKYEQNAYEGADLQFIGTLQTNKVKFLVGKVSLIQSVGSVHLGEAIAKEAAKHGIRQDILLEVNIGREENKSGVLPEALPELLEEAAALPRIHVRGLMAIPPVSEKKGDNLRYFAEMRNLFVDIRAKKYDNVSMECLSMGMSDDFADAIAEGSTMVRIGTAIFGKRNYNI